MIPYDVGQGPIGAAEMELMEMSCPAARGGWVNAILGGARGGRRTGGPPGKALQRADHKVFRR
jgi:hypothetical protein